jgi:hypothetical protein
MNLGGDGLAVNDLGSHALLPDRVLPAFYVFAAGITYNAGHSRDRDGSIERRPGAAISIRNLHTIQ